MQAAQMQELFARYKAFKSSEVGDLEARLGAALRCGGGGATCGPGKENNAAAAALQHDALLR